MLRCTCEGSQDGLQKPHVRVRASFTSCDVCRPRHPHVATLVSVSRTPMRTTHFTNHCTEQRHPKTRFFHVHAGTHTFSCRCHLDTRTDCQRRGYHCAHQSQRTNVLGFRIIFIVLPTRAMRSTLRRRGVDLGPDRCDNKVTSQTSGHMKRTRVKMSTCIRVVGTHFICTTESPTRVLITSRSIMV